jgi:hypothetical protein
MTYLSGTIGVRKAKKKKIAMAWKMFRSLGFILSNKYQKLETKKPSWNPAYSWL